jgi:hypothetical protein
VFTQTKWDEEGYPIRDPDSTTYVGAIETAEQFGRRLYVEAWKRGWSQAEKKVVMGDGAEWIWNLADQHFPGAVQIVDLYHARQHLWELARKLFLPGDEAKQKRWIMVQQNRLDKGKIEKLVGTLRSIESANPEAAEKLRTEADYLERNAERMRYPEFRRQHLFVGSGVIEAGCKTVIGSRLKQSGMLDGSGSQCHHCPALLPAQRPLRGLLGREPGGCLTSTSKSCTPLRAGTAYWTQGPRCESRFRM